VSRLFVVDTNAIISHYGDVLDRDACVTSTALGYIKRAFLPGSDIRLSVPSFVFVEMVCTLGKSQEARAKLRYEVFEPIRNCPNIEIRPLEKDTLHQMMKIADPTINLENHDKIMLASAMVLDCPLITSDAKILQFNRKHKAVSQIVT
jgi:predicted nucleic acid-binding protein